MLNHLKKHDGEGPITITPRMISYWWRILNSAVFDGKLIKPAVIDIGRRQGYWGMCLPSVDGKLNLLLTRNFPSKRIFLEMLVHEMVHVWEYQRYSVMTHGTSFFEWKEWIKSTVDLNLSIRIKNDHGQ